MRNSYRYIYGPVSSWRLGSSLGIDPLSRKQKVCSFDCIYCQVGDTGILADKRQIFVPTKDIMDELNSLSSLDIDYITFSGRGEPTLAKNLGEMIGQMRRIRKEMIAVITNSSLMHRKDVRTDLALSDLVMAKLDACSEGMFLEINKPVEGINFKMTLEGIREFKAIYKGRLALQIMFVEANKNCAMDIASIVREIAPDEVQINTPLRPSGARPLSREEIGAIKKYFTGMDVISVYDAERRNIDPVNREDTIKRRGI